MYAPSDSPLPPNSTQPYPVWLQNWHRIKKLKIEMAAAQARAAVLCSPNPASFIDLGPQIMADVARSPSQGTLTGSTALTAPVFSSPTPTAISAPPTVVPLDNVTSVAVAQSSAPRGTQTTGTQQSGTPWGNSPIIPPGATSFFASIPAWVWVGAGIVGLMSIGGPGRKKGIF